jgi:hypothetical protein
MDYDLLGREMLCKLIFGKKTKHIVSAHERALQNDLWNASTLPSKGFR